ncbi:MAG TPA: hypothetical protein VGD14_24275 [bacterium]
MTRVDILEELNRFTTNDRLEIIEAAIHEIRKELHQKKLVKIKTKTLLVNAAKALQEEYKTNKELTAFAVLDSEDFYE